MIPKDLGCLAYMIYRNFVETNIDTPERWTLLGRIESAHLNTELIGRHEATDWWDYV